mgnify:CR=1 FL=1
MLTLTILLILEREGIVTGWLHDVMQAIENELAKILEIILNLDYWLTVTLPADINAALIAIGDWIYKWAHT